MGSTQFGNFENFCRDSTLPICNILIPQSQVNQPPGAAYPGCQLRGISLGGNPPRYLANLGTILLDAIAVLTVLFLFWRSQRKAAAVGRREMQLFLIGFLIISICEIFTVGGFPISDSVRRGFTAVHIAAITATIWILLMNACVGYQLLDDGTPLSVGLIIVSAAAFFIGTGYIALDTGFSLTHYWDDSYGANHRNIALYVLYQLCPLVFLFLFFVLESILVLRVLEEFKPMLLLVGAALLFAIGQIFNYVVSTHICQPTHGAINGTFFQTFFNILSVVTIWFFWSSITEDDWPTV